MSTACGNAAPASPASRFATETSAIRRRISIVALPRCGVIATFGIARGG
jgi:hypothetical protein